MQYQPVDLIGAFYADDSLLWSAQDCVNWLPTVAMQKGTRTEAKLATPPGLSYFTQCGEGPIRGARDVEGKLFVVSGNELYEVAYDGTPTLRGTIPGVGLVSMSHNKRGYGNQLLIVNGDAGYVWNTSAATLTKITDSGYPGSVQVDYLDHYLIQVEPWGRFWFHSNLDDALDYNTLDQYDAEAAPDKLVGIAANQLEAVVFGQKTIEFFANTGALTGTFQSKRIVIERGCASRHTIVKLDNTLMWLGNDGIFYRLNGYGAQPISTGPIHKAIAGLNWANAFGFVWEDKGYKVAYWTFPDGQTWGYDATQPPGYQWHRRESYGLNRWRLNTCTLWQKRHIGGDYRTGVLYLVDWLAQHEMGEPLVSERTGGTANANQNAVICPYVELIFDTGGPAWDGLSGLPPVPPVPPPVEPVVWTQGSGVLQKTDDSTTSAYYGIGNPHLKELFTHRASGRVFAVDTTSVQVFSSGAADDPIGTPIIYTASGMGGEIGFGLRGQGSVDQVAGDAFFCRNGGWTIVRVDASNTVSEFACARPSKVTAVGSGVVAVAAGNSGEIRFYGPSNGYASPTATITGKWSINAAPSFDSAGRRIFYLWENENAGFAKQVGIVNADTAAVSGFNHGLSGTPELINYSESVDLIAVTTPNSGNYGKSLVYTPAGALALTANFSAVLSPATISTKAIDAAVLGSILAVVQQWSTGYAVHLIDLATGSVVHTKNFAGMGDVFWVTPNTRDGVFYCGGVNQIWVVSISATAPYTEATITTGDTDNRIVEWL